MKRIALIPLTGSIVCGALVGIASVLIGSFGAFQVKVLLSTFTVACASLGGLACSAARRKEFWVLPWSGITLSSVTAGMFLLTIWANLDSESYLKATVSLAVYSAAITHVCLLSIVKLNPPWKLAYYSAYLISFGLATLIVVTIYWEFKHEYVYRSMAAVAILDAAISLFIPLVSKLGKQNSIRSTTDSGEAIEVAQLDAEIEKLRREIERLEQRKFVMAKKAAVLSESLPTKPPMSKDWSHS